MYKRQPFSSYLTEIANDDTSNAEDGNGGFRGSEFDTRVIAAWMQYSALSLIHILRSGESLLEVRER